MLRSAQKLIPPLLPQFHKGQCGRVLVVGGCIDYSGAPYFAAMASALAGADMSHILCSKGAGPVIKGYSPNLMVHPYLTETSGTPLSPRAIDLLSRIHVVLIGPGLGRDESMLDQVTELVDHIKRMNIPLILDADGLYLLQNNTKLLDGVNEAILTPNVVEFGRLLKAFDISSPESDSSSQDEQAIALSAKTGAVVLVKGKDDVIANADTAVHNHTQGSLRRVSGQGDTLSGTLTTFLAWKKAWESKLWESEPISEDPLVVAAYAASTVVREASALAFAAKGRGMVTTDVNERVAEAFANVFGDGSKTL